MNTNVAGRLRKLEKRLGGWLHIDERLLSVDVTSLTDAELNSLNNLPPPPGCPDTRKMTDAELGEYAATLQRSFDLDATQDGASAKRGRRSWRGTA